MSVLIATQNLFAEEDREKENTHFEPNGMSSSKVKTFDADKNMGLNLTDEELDYLKNKKTITMCYPTEYPPYTMMEHDQPVGIIIDSIRHIENKIGIPFEFIYADTLKEQFTMAKNGACESVSLVVTSPQLISFLSATKPLGRDTISLVTKIDKQYVFDLATIADQTIGIDKQTVNVIQFVKEHYPQIKYVELDGVDLDKVVDGEIYGFIGPSVHLNYLVSKKYANELKLMRTLDHSIEGSIGVQRSEPLLLSILNKAIMDVGQFSKEEVYSKWINIKYKKSLDYTLLYQIIFITLFPILIFFYWNVRLRQEIKKRKEIESHLIKSEQTFKALFDLAPVLIDAFDEHGKCTLWNNECEKVFGWSIEELNARENSLALFYPDINDQHAVSESLSTQNKAVFREWHPLSKSGKIITCMWANVQLPNSEVINIGYDITELREVQHELNQLNQVLESKVEVAVTEIHNKEILLQQQSRLAQMGEMITMIAHQWRQPLSVISASVFDIQTKLDLEKFDLDDKESQEKFLKFLHHELADIHYYTQHLSNTIEDFRNYFKPDKEKEFTFLSEPITKALQLLHVAIKNNDVEMVCDFKTDRELLIYTNELMQVILNIIKNSIDNFIERETPHPKIVIEVFTNNDHDIIKICDNGGGIDEAILPKIFDPYFSTKDEKNGTGLGLYMSKMIIEEHNNGTLHVNNTNQGVCIEINFKDVP